MTSINALRFDDYSGIMLCDAQRSWNPEDMKLFISDKIKPCIPPEIAKEAGLVAAYGNTGTSTVGDEIKFSIFNRLREEYRELKEKKPEALAGGFKTIEELSSLIYDVILNMKHTHISQQIKSLYGFESSDYLRGYYEVDGKKIEIKDKEILQECHKFVTWKDTGQEVRAVFLNAGIVAGFEDKEGFKIFEFSLYKMYCQPVEVAFVAGGSGSDMVRLHMTDFLSKKSLMEKRGDIDPVEGTMELIHSLNSACYRNIGVGDYYTIILFNGKAEKSNRMTEICDHHSKLASEIVIAQKEGFISLDTGRELVKKLLFEKGTFEELNDSLFKNCNNKKDLLNRLRGYKQKKAL